MIEVIDVSAFQPGQLDYRAIAAAGIAAVYVKATDGLGSPDAQFRAHVAGFRSFGIPVGAYHYLLGRPEDAAQQADEFALAYERGGCTLLPAVDIEDAENHAATPQRWRDAVAAFDDRIQARLGSLPMTYSYPWFWAVICSALEQNDIGRTKLWWADYVHATESVPVPRPWTSVLLHQYTDKGSLPGIPGHVDRSRCLGDVKDLLL